MIDSKAIALNLSRGESKRSRSDCIRANCNKLICDCNVCIGIVCVIERVGETFYR